MKKLTGFFQSRPDTGLFLLRLFVGLRLLYGTIDNMISWERMREFAYFLELNSIPVPILSAVISVCVQFFGGICILLGFRIRLASAFLVFNFLVALYVHISSGDTVEYMTGAFAMFFCSLAFLFTGPGRISLDAALSKRRKS